MDKLNLMEIPVNWLLPSGEIIVASANQIQQRVDEVIENALICGEPNVKA